MKRSVYAVAVLSLALAGCDQINNMIGGDEEAAPKPAVAETPPAEEPETPAEPVAPTVSKSLNLRLGKLNSSEIVTATRNETGVVVAGGSDELSSGGRTQGAHFVLDSEFEEAASGNQVRVVVSAVSEAPAAKLFAAYSTREVGGSGWQEWDISSATSKHSFTFDVPEMKEGRFDFLGFYAPDAPVTITSARVEVLE